MTNLPLKNSSFELPKVEAKTSFALFDPVEWRAKLETLADSAAKGCGSSHDLYVQRFSESVECELEKLNPAVRAEALVVALKLDYATPDEREETRSQNENDGYCSHGIALDCCPAGCE